MSAYDNKSVEAKWQRYWKDNKIYHFDPNSTAPVYSIDNPPRYASGALHAGHAVNYTQIDFAARYKRMKGHNVFFPLCFDTNGTPIEVKVEKKYNMDLHSTDRHEFIAKCREFANGFIEEMTYQFELLGESMDPSIYYQTDAEYYRKLTQISFIRLFKKDLIYKGKFPINWCPRCGTAIADAEVEYVNRDTKLNYIHFKLKDTREQVTIATTRPELLCACQMVAVHPEDGKLNHLIGKKLLTPIYEKEVEVLGDENVDPEFGTGTVMICTIGDKDDLEWINKYNLPFDDAIDKKGCMTDVAGKYEGMSLEEARKTIIQDMKDLGLLTKQEPLNQNVGGCWRCSTPIEFLRVPQWFLKILDSKEEVLAHAENIKWFPKYMKLRLEDWVNSLAWDWPISRQRYFATPIPLWECRECGEVVLANEEDCYIDPTLDQPPVEKCPKCQGDLEGCRDVFDTWMDSSISPLFNSFWERDPALFKKLFPMSMRPQAQDIIRTWAYYTILRSHLLEESKPWNDIMIGAYILSSDGTPMHASKGNVIDPLELLEQYGSDAVRYWAATCGLGEDSPVNYKELTRGQRLINKLWNVERLIGNSLEGQVPDPVPPEQLRAVDRWILTKYSHLVEDSTQGLDAYTFDKVIKDIEYFVWHELADHYLEMVKYRIYASDPTAKYVLHTLGLGITKLLAPFIPHVTEEIFQTIFKKSEEKSIHLASWPLPVLADEEAVNDGELAKDIIAALRNWKSEKGIALNAEITEVEMVAGSDKPAIERCLNDITNTINITSLKFIGKEEVKEEITAVKPVHASIGPKFRQKAKFVSEYLKDLNGEELQTLVDTGTAKITTDDGEEVVLEKEDFQPVKASTYHGKEVEIIKVNDVLVLLSP